MSWDWPLTIQVVGTVAAAVAAIAAWRSAALSGRAVKLAGRERVRSAEDRLSVMRRELLTARFNLSRTSSGKELLRGTHANHLKRRQAELLEPKDSLPNVRKFSDPNHDTRRQHIDAAIEDVDAALATLRQNPDP
jgi:hypothetical protein